MTTIYNNPNIFLVSYLGGSFGNALANLINSAILNEWREPKRSNYHTMPWPYDSEQAFLQVDSALDFFYPIDRFSVVQFHCMNSNILRTRFPASKGLILTYKPQQEIYILNRLWRVLFKPNSSGQWIDQVIESYNHIVYNKKQLEQQQICFDACDRIQAVAFDQVVSSRQQIENLIGSKISDTAITKYQNYIHQQMIDFEQLEPCIAFAWQVYESHGVNAPIIDIATNSSPL